MHSEANILYWPALIRGILIRRYKRFLADILLDSGETITAHCANSGAMTHCSEAGRTVWVAHEPGPKRKFLIKRYICNLIFMAFLDMKVRNR